MLIASKVKKILNIYCYYMILQFSKKSFIKRINVVTFFCHVLDKPNINHSFTPLTAFFEGHFQPEDRFCQLFS